MKRPVVVNFPSELTDDQARAALRLWEHAHRGGATVVAPEGVEISRLDLDSTLRREAWLAALKEAELHPDAGYRESLARCLASNPPKIG